MKNTNDTKMLSREKKHFSYFLSAFFVSAASGFTTYFSSSLGFWVQWLYLAHVVSSVLFIVFLAPYIAVHIQRTLGQRRMGVFFSGILKTLVLLSIIISGLHILFFGQLEVFRWVYESHIYFSYALVIAALFHMLFHIKTVADKRRSNTKTVFLTVDANTGKHILVFTLASALSIVMGFYGYRLIQPIYSNTPIIDNYQYNYGNHPFRPSQTETHNGNFIDQRLIANSHTCEPCHQEITKQWKASMHRQAGSDKTYITNINLLESNKGISATRYCEGCHSPVALLTGQLTEGGKHGGRSDSAAFAEGVGCMGCHGIEKVVHDKGVASYQFKPAADYLFANSDNKLGLSLHNFLIRISPQQHRKDMARDVLSSPQLCATCHAQFMDKDLNNWGWVKMQDDYKAWLNSPFSGQNRQNFSHSNTQRCQDCHMPKIKGLDPSSDNNNLIVSHNTLGANTAIPWINQDFEQFEKTKDFLQSGKMRVTIDTPNRNDAIRDDKYVAENLLSNIESPAFAYLEETLTIKTTVGNIGVGHNFPGGTIDINQAWIWFKVVDAQNEPVFESGALNEQGVVDPTAVFFRSLPVDKEGKLVWKHDLFNMIGRSYKKVIPSGDSDVVEHTFTVPSWVKSPLTVSVVLRYRKFNQRYAKWALKEKYTELPIVDMAWDAIKLPIKKKPPVSSFSTKDS